MKKTVIVYAHPYEKSFNHAILETLKASVDKRGEECDVIDLYADGFDPAYHPEELALFKHGKFLDPKIEKYQKALKEASRVIFIFPVWWSDMPAMMKGFFDKTMLPGYAYTVEEGKWIPGLDNVAQTIVITTSEAPTEAFKPYFGDYFLRNSLDAIGLTPNEWHNCPAITAADPTARKAFLAVLPSLLK